MWQILCMFEILKNKKSGKSVYSMNKQIFALR